MPAVARTKRISPEVHQALSSIEWDGNNAVLTCGRLEPKVYKATNDVLETLGGKWNKKAKAHVFTDAAHDELEMIIETGEYTSGADLKQVYGEFFTPDALADEVVRFAEIHKDLPNLLEPSAGDGSLLRAVARAGHYPYTIAVELQSRHDEVLNKTLSSLGLNGDVRIMDFLSAEPVTSETPEINGTFEMEFDRIVMNPPFARQADVDHVLHAWKFLAPGGRLVAIMSTSWTFRSNKKSVDFRQWLDDVGGEIHANPENSFKVSGTGVKTVTIVVDK